LTDILSRRKIMHSINNVYYKTYDFNTLLKAHYLCRRGKRDKPEVISFEKFLNCNLMMLKEDLENKTYKIGDYKIFIEHYPKKRVIMYLPYRDRVVQRAFCDSILRPLLEPTLIYDNYASRIGKGVQFGIERTKRFMRGFYNKYGTEGWILKGDIFKYFPSINHAIVKKYLYPKIKDKDIIWLLDTFIDSVDKPENQRMLSIYNSMAGIPITTPGKGLPIGNMIFQLLAVYYLNPLDWFVKEELKIKYYSRYMDDFILISHDKEYLQYCLKRIRNLVSDLDLKLNNKTQIFPIQNGINYLGWHFYLTDTGKVIMKIRKDSSKRMKRKIKRFNTAYDEGELTFEDINRSVQSWTAHAKHGNTYYLRKNVLSRLKLEKCPMPS
jgi:hypothetical protein